MTLIEMVLAGEKESVMISMDHISEVEEMGVDVRIHMESGNTYVVTGSTFAAALNETENVRYLKISTKKEEAPKEVEGELILATRE